MKKCLGVTLLELVLVIVLLGAITALGGDVIIRAVKNMDTQANIINASWQARLALFRFEHELDDAQSINSASSSSITFIEQNNSSVEWQRNASSELLRNTQLASQDVTSFTLSYYNSSFSTATQTSDIRCIGINTTLSNNGILIPLQSVVCPWNLSL